MDLKFYVSNQTLTRRDNEVTASGSKNYLFADFRFSAEWSGAEKTAVFVSADESVRYHMLLVGGRCSVPAELIAEGGFYVSVFGGNRITSTRIFVDVSESGIEPGLTPPEPTEEIYDQIMDRLSAVSDEVGNISIDTNNIKDGAVTAEKLADGVLFSKKYSDLTDIPTEFNPGEHYHCIDDISDLYEATQDGAGLMSAADKKLLDEIADSGIMSVNVRLSDYQGDGGSVPFLWFALPYEAGEEFRVYMDVSDEYLHYLGGANVYSLNKNDELGWILSQPIYEGHSYLMKITKQPVTGVDGENGTIEVISEVANSLENRLAAIESSIGDANAVLEEILTEGV